MLVLFDLDGTLTDPYDGITRSVLHALAALGVPAPDALALRGFIGPPLHDSFAALGLPAADVGRAVDIYRERFTVTGLYENRVYPGIDDALNRIGRAGARLAVATSKPTPFARRILDHFGLADHFEHVAGASLDGAMRHKADVIAAALQALGEPAAQAVMVGDRVHDVTGAHSCGVVAVGVRWGYAEPGELEQAGAERIVAEPADLPAAVHDLLVRD